MAGSPDPIKAAIAAAGQGAISDTGGPHREGYPSSAGKPVVKLAARLAGLVMVVGAALWLSVSTGVKRIDSGLFLRPVALHMMAGEPYDAALIEAMDADMSVVLSDPVCDYQALQDLAVVRAALAETAFQGDDADLADRRLTATEQAAKASLACSPGSPRAWTILAWIEHIRHEDTPLLRTYLRKSFQTGAYEGWPLIRRMEILLSLYPKLDPAELADLKQSVNWLAVKQWGEFVGELYLAAKPEARIVIRDVLAQAPERAQKRAADVIRNGGEDIDLPAVEPLGSRPWK